MSPERMGRVAFEPSSLLLENDLILIIPSVIFVFLFSSVAPPAPSSFCS